MLTNFKLWQKSKTKILTKLNNLSSLKTENANSERKKIMQKKNILNQKVFYLEQLDTSTTGEM